MKLSAQTLHLKRTALLLAAAVSPLFATAAVQSDAPAMETAARSTSAMVLASLEESPAVAHQKALRDSLTATLRASVNEVAMQATLIRSAHAQLNMDLASGNARAIKASEAKLAGYQVAFMKAQQNVRANLLQLQSVQGRTESRLN